MNTFFIYIYSFFSFLISFFYHYYFLPYLNQIFPNLLTDSILHIKLSVYLIKNTTLISNIFALMKRFFSRLYQSKLTKRIQYTNPLKDVIINDNDNI